VNLVVTGASSGIGRAIAIRAVREGWAVLATVRRETDRAALRGEGCATSLLELRDRHSIEAFSGEVLEWCGGALRALVNNAGIAIPGALEEQSIDEVREQFEVNVFGHVAVTQRLIPAVREARGTIVFVSSDRAGSPVPLYGAYAASKRALAGFAEVLSLELGDAGVRVETLELGAYESNIRTRIRARFDELARESSPYGDLVRTMRARLGSPPLGAPEEAAEKVMSLLSPV
jgi:NAD(P)-dependent dehydrogenase (short-subunit alcohol dehydrogenase family)